MSRQTNVGDQNDEDALSSGPGRAGGQNASSEKKQLKDPQVRKAGAFMILLSRIASKFFIFDTLDKIRTTHDAAIQYSTKIIILAPVLFIFGLALCIGGSKVLQALKERRKIGAKQYLFLLVALVPAFITQFWFESELSKMGYHDMR